MAYRDLQAQTGTNGKSLRRALDGLQHKRLVRHPSTDGGPLDSFELTRRGWCVYELLRTLERSVAAA